MRNVRKGNVSVPLAIVDAYLNAAGKNTPEAGVAVMNMHKAIVEAQKRINDGLDQSNLTVCVGKFGYVNPSDVTRFLSREIPRITIHAENKANHAMPLYYKHKPSYYRNKVGKALKRPSKKSKDKG